MLTRYTPVAKYCSLWTLVCRCSTSAVPFCNNVKVICSLSQSLITVYLLYSCYQLIIIAEEAPKQPQIATEPLAALLQYCITGSQYVKGREIREVRVVK
jgi:hypothetical protein